MKRGLHNILVHLCRLLRRNRSIDPSTIACIEVNRLGDVIVLLAVLPAIRSKYPSSKLVVAVMEEYADLARSLGVMDVVIPLRGRKFTAAIAALRREKPTIACSMSPSTRNTILALSSSRQTVGYLAPPKSLPGFFDESETSGIGVEVSAGKYHDANIYKRGMLICELLGTGEVGIGETPLSHRMTGRGGERGAIVIHPGAYWFYRRWPVNSWRGLMGKIRLNGDVKIICIGGSADNMLLKEVSEGFDCVEVRVGEIFLNLVEILRNARLFVGNDSGPLHLAANMGIPVIGLYGPASPALSAPLHTGGEFLYRKVECSPCPQEICIRPHAHCMTGISIDEVYERIKPYL